ncbi:MAG TPA: hypothetical protein VNZ86_05435, partial [Bacteroidia bacterium]|nr:hypothetical protein [Bacteroidia bacterium]
MSKRLLLILCALTALIIVSLTVFKHHPKNGLDEKVNPAFGAYISAYTSGIISNESHIRIRFASEVASIAEFDKQAKEEVFSFSPSLPGKAFWIDSRTLEYRPTSRMPSDQKYEVSLSLGKLIQVPSEFKTFDFSFRTMPQQMDVKVDGIKTIDRKTLAWEQLNGILSTADAADNALVEKTVTATQDGKPLHLHWEHADPATHKFTVDSIQRKTAAGKIELNWNGEVISA